MTEIKKTFADRLIEQDEKISPTSLQEQIMKIETSVETLEQKAHSSQRFTVRAVAAVVVCYAFGMTLNAVSIGGAVIGIVAPVWSFCTLGAMVTAAVAAVRYWTIHRPQLEKGRIDLQVTMFRELQRQLSELQKRQ